MAYAFRCKNCNSLAESGHAGEMDVPAKCATCGAGVSYSPDGIKSYHPENWVVLADLSEDELAEVLDYHKIEADEVEAHVPTPAVDPTHEPQTIEVSAGDVASLEDLAR